MMKKLKKNASQPKLEVNTKEFDQLISADGASYTVKVRNVVIALFCNSNVIPSDRTIL